MPLLSEQPVSWVQGRIVALDKSKNKLAKVMENTHRWGIDCVEVYNFDATKSLDQTAGWSSLSRFMDHAVHSFVLLFLLRRHSSNEA